MKKSQEMKSPMEVRKEKIEEALAWALQVERSDVNDVPTALAEVAESMNCAEHIKKLPFNDAMIEFYKGLIKDFVIMYDTSFYRPRALGFGNSGLVIEKNELLRKDYEFPTLERVCYKFSKNLEKDYYFLQKIHDATNGYPKKLPKLLERYCVRDAKNVLGVAMEGDFGMMTLSLCRALLPQYHQKYINLSNDLVLSLIEMRSAGIWHHRDINPRNMLAFGYGIHYDMPLTSKIIDFEYATEDKKEISRDGNRRFWGPNDLNSLGNTMYYMVEVNSPFSEVEPKIGDLSDISEHIYSQAKKAYSNPKGPEMRKALAKIEKFENQGLGEITRNLILAKENDHEKMLKICEKYITEE